MATENKTLKIEIWSDIMCPFCYIGKRHLEAALQDFSEKQNVAIEWKSFQLDPDMPDDRPGNIYDYLAERKGISYEAAEQMHVNVTDMAKKAGLDYHFDKAKIANSFKAHRLIQYAKTKDLGEQAEERLFHAYFTEGKNVGDEATLKELGKDIGLSEADVNEALGNGLYAERVEQDIHEAEHLGIRGVPFFVLNRKYAVSGAQPSQAFLGALEKAYSEL